MAQNTLPDAVGVPVGADLRHTFDNCAIEAVPDHDAVVAVFDMVTVAAVSAASSRMVNAHDLPDAGAVVTHTVNLVTVMSSDSGNTMRPEVLSSFAFHAW